MVKYSISLSELLAARDRRVEKREKLLAKYEGVALAVLLNIPGSIKDSKEYRKTFDFALVDIKEFLNSMGIQIITQKVDYFNTGPEAILILNSQAPHLKSKMIEIESKHPLGRILDLDVYNSNGEQLSRTMFNESVRKCLLCSEDAKICSRTQKHDIDDLLNEINNIINDFSYKIS